MGTDVKALALFGFIANLRHETRLGAELFFQALRGGLPVNLDLAVSPERAYLAECQVWVYGIDNVTILGFLRGIHEKEAQFQVRIILAEILLYLPYGHAASERERVALV